MNIKIKYILLLYFVLLYINLIKSDGSDATVNTSSDDDSTDSRGSGSVWSDGNGDLNSIEFCPSAKKLCEKGSYRDTDERVHLVSYCIEKDEECCGCNSVLTPHRVNSSYVQLIKVGSCFGCPSTSTCEFKVFSDGLQRFCASSGSMKNSPIIFLILILSFILIII